MKLDLFARRTLTQFLALTSSFLLVACSQQQMLDKISTPQERSLAESAITDVVRGDTASLARKMPSELGLQLPAAMNEMRSYLPAATISRVQLVDASFVTSGIRRAQLTYQLSGKAKFSLAQVIIVTSGENLILESIFISPLKGPVGDLNRFDLAGKSAAQYGTLGAALVAFALTVGALFKVWRSGLFDRRWLWTVGSLVGLTTLKINWVTGDWMFQPLSFQLFSASAMRQGVLAPWLVGVSIPLVAMIVLARRRRGSDDVVDAEDMAQAT